MHPCEVKWISFIVIMKKRETNFMQISLNDFDDDDGSSSSYGSSGIFIYMNVSTWCGSVKWNKLNILIIPLYYNIKISSVEDDEFDELYDHYEQGDTKLQLGHPSIKTTARKIGDQAMWDLFEVCIISILAWRKYTHILHIRKYNILSGAESWF